MRLKGLQGSIYTTDNNPFASGGEGAIYKISNAANLVAKVYTSAFADGDRLEKLMLMSKHPPSKETLKSLSWPVDVLKHENGSFAGFAMPALNTDKTLNDIYVYQESPEFDLRKRIALSYNICAVIEDVHKTGCVFGDFNADNIGVNTSTGHAAFFDVDSFHVDNRQGNGKFYRAVACFPGYAAPEVLKTCRNCERDTGSVADVYLRAKLPTFTVWSDYFALAIHIFKLLFNGFDPYSGVSNATGKSSKVLALGDKAVENDQYCFKDGKKPANLLVPPLKSVPKEIGDLFKLAFVDSNPKNGEDAPKKRPGPQEWQTALLNYRDNLAKCKANHNHYYYSNLPDCVWCEATARNKNKNPWPDKWPPAKLGWGDVFGKMNDL